MRGPNSISPIVWILALIVGGLVAARVWAPIPRRALAPISLWSRKGAPPPAAQPSGAATPLPPRPAPIQPFPLYDSWFRDLGAPDVCGFDLDLSQGPRFELHLTEGPAGPEPLLSRLDLMFLAWVSHRYQINPHFLLGIMHAESAGDCSAVSVAGAQGCFQITDSAGAQQLANSYPERMADWYWAPRRLLRPTSRPWPPEARDADYYPQDIFVAPSEYFRELVGDEGWTDAHQRRARRQLRRLIDPVATEARSDRYGDLAVSSVVSFGFGAIGSALFFHWEGRLLFEQSLLHEDIRAAFAAPGAKALWMATGYNQGGPRSVRALARRGPAFMDAMREDVAAYARRVTGACLDLEQGEAVGPTPITWGQFSDFLQELRWTYSAVPIQWEPLRERLRRAWFAQGPMDLADLPQVFDHMEQLDSYLTIEEPVMDFRLGWEGG